MGFYFTVHVIIGLCFGSISWTMKRASAFPSQTPKWAFGAWGQLSLAVASVSALGAVITTAINFPIIWALATTGEIILGAFIAGLIPLGLRFLIAALSAPINVIIVGALWGFWYI